MIISASRVTGEKCKGGLAPPSTSSVLVIKNLNASDIYQVWLLGL